MDALGQRARDLARLQGRGRAFALRLRRCQRGLDPLAHFAELPPGRRRLLQRDGDWLLVNGQTAAWHSDGPDRFASAARQVHALQQRVVIEAPSGAPAVPLCWLEAAFASQNQTGLWGRFGSGCRLVLPAQAWWRRGGACWYQEAVSVPVEQDAHDPQQPATPLPAWDTLQLPDYRELVCDALILLRHGALRKVVLARAEDRQHQSNTTTVLQRVAETDAPGWLYAVDLDTEHTFLGRSPELLLASQGHQWQSMALAGSRPRSANITSDAALASELLSSTKERKEHQLVVEHLVQALAPGANSLSVADRPNLRRMPLLQHLETRLQADKPGAEVYQALQGLHPTPAVAGLPSALAQAWLARHEGLIRGLYTGVVGWRTPQASEHIVPLRGALLSPDRARLFAGAGLVETSEPDAEFAETELKLEPMRRVLG